MHISLLPEEVLGKILSLLPTEQAVSTSVLSKNWRNVYRLVENLDFDDSALGLDKLERVKLPDSLWSFLELTRDVPEKYQQDWYVFPESFKRFVDTTLAWQCDSPIKKFSLKCHVGVEKHDSQRASVGRWISNVVERGVLELDLRINSRGKHFMPPQLFTSETLAKLKLGTKLKLGKLPSYVSLPSLKTLFMDTVIFEKNDLCNVLLAGCPVLEELSIHHRDFEGTPLTTISSPTVKRLTVAYNCDYDRKELSLNLPNLVYLDYSDFVLPKYPQVNLKSLVEAKLDLYYKCSPDLTDLFSGIRNVEILHLSPVSVLVIHRCVRKGLLLPVFNKLVNLSFGINRNYRLDKRGWKLLPYLLMRSPKLEILTIQDLDGYTGNVTMPPCQVKVLHVVRYRGTAQELKQLKIFLEKIKCSELLQVEVAKHVVDDATILLQTKRDLMLLRGVSVSSECQIKVT